MSDNGDVSTAGNKRSSDEAGLDKPAPKTPERQSTEIDESGGNRQTPARCAPPERVVATARTISLAVTLPDDSGATLTELECDYKVDGAKKATTDTFKVDDPSAKQQIITLGVQHYLSLASRISSVRVKARNVRGPSRTFSLAAFDDEPLCCSPLDASLEELQAELSEGERQGSRLEVLARFLQKKQVPQLKQLAADLHIKTPQGTSKSDCIKSIVQSSQGGSVDAALSAAVDGKQKACVAAKAELANTQRVVDDTQASMDSQAESVQRAQAGADAAEKALAEAQRAAEATRQVLEKEEKKASTAERKASTARDQHEKEEKKATKAETDLANLKLVQEALKQAEAAKAQAPQPPPVAPPIVGTSSSLGSASSAGGRAAPPGLTALKLKNRIKKWAESDDIYKNSLQQCYKALGNKGVRDKETLISELFGGYEETVDFLRLPGPISDKKLALIYTSNKDMPPPPADGKDRAAMVDELASWLTARERGSPTPTAIVATLAAPTEAIVATLAAPAEAIQAAMIDAVAAAATAAVASQISLPLHRQPSTLNRVKRATVRIGLFDTTTRTIFSVGSGVIIRGPCGASAQVLTCAHNFIGTQAPHTLFGGRLKEDVVILVGCYLNDEQTSVWRHRAELLTPDELLFKKVPFGTNGRTTLLDLAVLRVDRSIEITPSAFQGLGTPAPVYQLGPPFPLFDDQNSCPLRSHGLELGSASAVPTGTAVSAAGWYVQRAEKTSTCPARPQPAHKLRTTSRTQPVHKRLPAPIDSTDTTRLLWQSSWHQTLRF